MLEFSINQGFRGHFHSMLSAATGKSWHRHKRYLTRLIPLFKFWLLTPPLCWTWGVESQPGRIFRFLQTRWYQFIFKTSHLHSWLLFFQMQNFWNYYFTFQKQQHFSHFVNLVCIHSKGYLDNNGKNKLGNWRLLLAELIDPLPCTIPV